MKELVENCGIVKSAKRTTRGVEKRTETILVEFEFLPKELYLQ